MDRYSEMEMTRIARAEFKRGYSSAIKEVLELVGWLQSTALIDSPNYFTTSIDNWEAFKENIAKLQEKTA